MDAIRLGAVTGSPSKVQQTTSCLVYHANIIVDNEIHRCYLKQIPDASIVHEYVAAEMLVSFGMQGVVPVVAFWNGKPAFASIDVNRPSIYQLVQSGEASKLNWFGSWTGLYPAAAFDELINNTDRNQQNILVGGKDDVVLIDHEKAFAGQAFNTNPTNTFLGLVSQTVNDDDEVGKRRILKLFEKAVNKFSCDPAINILEVLHKNSLINIDQRNKLADYIKHRCDNVHLLIEQQLKLKQIGLQLHG